MKLTFKPMAVAVVAATSALLGQAPVALAQDDASALEEVAAAGGRGDALQAGNVGWSALVARHRGPCAGSTAGWFVGDRCGVLRPLVVPRQCGMSGRPSLSVAPSG